MRFLLNPVVAMFYNSQAKTWHPGVFEEKPLPGAASDVAVVRHKSMMHHTAGFQTYNEAVENIIGDLVPKLKEHCGGCEHVRVYTDYVLSWDGTDIPVSTVIGDFCEVDREASKKALKEILDSLVSDVI